MKDYTYKILNEVEKDHWWFVGRRAILRSFLDEISSKFKVQSSKSVESDSQRFTDQADNTNLEPGTLNVEPRNARALRILDVGCGTGANLEMLSEYGQAEGVDISDEALEFCRKKGLNVTKGSAENLPHEDETFDLVTGLDVIEHLDDDVAGLSEMYRVLRPGGKILIFVPAFMWLWGVQDDISDHRIRYTRSQIVERVKNAGFSVSRATYANLTFFAPILGGRLFMRVTGIRPESENNVNITALNGVFGRVFSAERHWLSRANLPLGVSVILVADKD